MSDRLRNRDKPLPLQRIGPQKRFSEYTPADFQARLEAEREVKKGKYDEQTLKKYMENFEIGLLRRVAAAISAKEALSDTGEKLSQAVPTMAQTVFQNPWAQTAQQQPRGAQSSRERSDADLKSIKEIEKIESLSYNVGQLVLEQEKTVKLLESLREAVKGLETKTGRGQGNQQIDVDRRNRRKSGSARGKIGGAAAAIGGGLTIAGGLGAAAVGGIITDAILNRIGADDSNEDQESPPAANTPAEPQERPPVTNVRAESGTFRRSGTGGSLNVTYARTAEGNHYIDDREVDAQTYNRFRQLTGGDPQRDPRYRQYLQEAIARDDFAPDMTASRRVSEENTAELFTLVERIRTQPRVERPAAPAAAASTPPPPQLTPGASGPEGSDVDGLGLRPPPAAATAQPPPAPAPRISAGNSPRITTPRPAPVLGEGGDLAGGFAGGADSSRINPPAIQSQSATSSSPTTREVPEGATPVRLNGQVVGYMPEGGGPTVAFDSASQQGLEAARSQVIAGITPTRTQPPQATSVESPPPVPTLAAVPGTTTAELSPRQRREDTTVVETAPTSAVAPAEATARQVSVTQESEEQIYNRLFAETPENIRNDVEVQNDLRSEAALLSRRNRHQSDEAPSSDLAKTISNREVRPGALMPKDSVDQIDPMQYLRSDLLLKARKITFKGDEIEFLSGSMPMGTGGLAPPSAFGGEGGGQVSPQAVGGMESVPSTGGGGQATEGGAAPQATAAGTAQPGDVSGLKFAPGVDKRISEDIAQKVKQTETASGESLTITSGFRDPARNAAAGGARNSAHTTGKAVDIRFQGGVEDTVKLIQKASASGVGGIGVYRPGFVHLDTGSKRVWGPDYTARSIPDWAKTALQEHMTGQRQDSGGGGGGSDAAPVSSAGPTAATESIGSSGGGAEGGGSAATPVESSGGGGAELVSASTEAEVQDRAVPSQSQSQAGMESTPDSEASNPSMTTGQYSHDPSDPGSVEPEDAAERYSRLFNMAA